MNTENPNLTIQKLVQTEGWKTFMQKLELVSTILLVVTLLLRLVMHKVPFWGLVITLTLSTLAIVSFFMGFLPFESSSKLLSNIFYKIYGLGLALGFNTILFTLEKWPTFPAMIPLSISLIIVSLFLGVLEKQGENKNMLDWKYFVRLFIALIPLVYIVIK
jgi:hypothetical protein